MTRLRSLALAASTCLATAALMAGPSGLGLSLSLLAAPALAQTAEELEKQYGREAMQQALETKRRYDVYGIRFDFDKATIQPETEPLLDDIAATMKNLPDWRLRIVGHTDAAGDPTYNQTLSQERAEAIKAELISRGIEAGRLETSGAGSSQSVAANDTPEGRALNRRVELVRLAAVKVKLEPYVTGINTPLAMVQPNGDDRKFVIEQWGRVRIIDAQGKLLPEPFLDIRNRLVDLWSDFDEKGLLGIAFHPQFAQNGRFYVAYSTRTNYGADLSRKFWWSHTNVVAEYKVSADDPNLADENSERIISSIDWPQFNHNGHWIGFGPDGMLYVSTGDGGYANDWGIGHNVTEGNGQDLSDPHGKILRLNPDGGPAAGNPFASNPEALPEIWAYGLRNPWRCSFDMGGTNQLFCADVQQNSYEEVNIVGAGQNMGWRRMEANHCFDYVKPDAHPPQCDKTDLVGPIIEYKNCTALPDGCLGISVTGGFVYRGSHKAWDGAYIFGDWSKSFAERDGQLFVGTKGADGKWTMDHMEVTGMEGKLPYVLAFAQDAAGEVYALTSLTTGPVGSLDTIYKIVPAQ